MKDFLGKKLEVGDEVIYMQLHYQSFFRGTIVKITPKRLVIERIAEDKPSWEEPTYRDSVTVVKV